MAGEESTHRIPGMLTEEQAGRMLADMNEVIRAGEEMRKLRAEMIKLFIGFGWTQDRIARLAAMSQPAVSKQMAKYRPDDDQTSPAELPMELSLDQYDIPWLEGRLWALAEEISEALSDTARCTRHVNAVARGRKRFTPENVDELRRLVEEDLRLHRATLPVGYRHAYDRISRGLDIPSKPTVTSASASASADATPGAAIASASVRRALAHRIQRDRFRDDA
ncbi:sigma-70 family RNA polymerase sigma factor [Streptomyces sp. NPDC059278]|uniref:sigma-70 family RNA polymerase sigma factor n=1 Tax=Streptomyces sp. NPDC059278 TaxID=3346801 RepID=UPI0036D15BA1